MTDRLKDIEDIPYESIRASLAMVDSGHPGSYDEPFHEYTRALLEQLDALAADLAAALTENERLRRELRESMPMTFAPVPAPEEEA